MDSQHPQSLPATSGEGVIVCDHAGRIIEVNEFACALTGYGVEELLSRSIGDLAPRFDATEVERCLENLQGEATLTVQMELRRKDASPLPFSLRLSSSREPGARRAVIRMRRRRRAAEVLPEDESFIRAVLDAADHLLVVLDAAGRIVLLNKTCEQHLGHSFAETRGRSYKDVLLPASGAADAPPRSEQERTGLPSSGEADWLTRDGRRRRIAWSIRDIHVREGSLRYSVLTGVDVTELRDLEQKRAADSVLIDASGEAIFAKMLDGTVTAWSPAAEKLYGYSAQEMIGQSVGIMVPPEARDEIAALLGRVRQGESVRDHDAIRIRKDGARIAVDLSLSPMRGEGGRVTGALVIAREVSEPRRVEAKFRRLLDAAPDATVIVDQEGTIVLASAQVESLLGYRKADIEGRPVEVLIPERLRSNHEADRAEYMREPRFRAMGNGRELTAQRRDGSEFPAEISLSPLSTPEGMLISAAIRDVTHRKAVERRLEIRDAVSRALAESVTFSEAAPRVLEAIAQGMSWFVGGLWLVDPSTNTLGCAELWLAPPYRGSEFETASRAIRLAGSRGPVGRAWASGSPVLLTDLGEETDSEWAEMALRAGFRSEYGFPVLLNGSVIGVLDFFSPGPITVEEESRSMFASIGAQIGQVLNRRRTEDALRASEAKLELLLRQMPLAVWAIDRNMIITYCAGKLYGTGPILPPEAYLGKSQEDILPSDHPALQVHHNALAGKAGRYDLERHGVSFKCVVEPLQDRDGRIVGALSAAIDVTDLKQTQNLLQASEARLSLMTEQAPACLWTTDRELRLTSAAGAILPILGFQASDVLGRTVAEASRIIGLEEAPEHEHHGALEGEHAEFECRIGGRALSGRVEPLRDRKGEILGVVGVAVDVTDRKRAETEYEHLNAELERRVQLRTGELEGALKEMEAFTYAVAHDLRAPLRALHGMSDLLFDEYVGRVLDDQGHDFLRRIRDAARRMDTLIQDLLAYSQLRSEQIPREAVELRDLATGAVNSLADEIRNRGAEVRVEETSATVLSNPALLGQAVMNILSNAVKFVAPGIVPVVRIFVEKWAGSARLCIEDNGIGIAQEHHDRIFGVFQRLHRQEEYPGTGIGLALVRRAVERMDGRVGVSSAPGKGSTFWIELPTA